MHPADRPSHVSTEHSKVSTLSTCQAVKLNFDEVQLAAFSRGCPPHGFFCSKDPGIFQAAAAAKQ
jgi:hypothetical protein